ncbi:MAG: hypothetical protein HRT36_00940 [Alphaproteobacteria bacterium]|nr:hypothetical protein [Alphaproteobacteria bacterium]
MGYSSQQVLPDMAYRLLVFLGTVFPLLIISAARGKMYRLTVRIGALLCNALPPLPYFREGSRHCRV